MESHTKKMSHHTKTRPDHAITVTTYAGLETYVQAFAEGHLNLLVIIGSAGLQKSRLVRTSVGDRAFWVESKATAFGLYRELYEHRNEPVILDDLDSLFRDRDTVRLLKGLLQTDPVKTVSWHTIAAGQAGLPTSFQTTSRAVVISNVWRTLDANVVALEDRGHIIVFEPLPLEVHQRTAEWFWDQEVFDFIGQHLSLITRPTMRNYLRAYELRKSGMPWRDLTLTHWLTGKELLAAQLRTDPSFASQEERARAFQEKGGGCRATYFSILKRLPPLVDAPEIVLTSRPPEIPAPPAPALDLIELLRQRHGKLGQG
jgi:hypothetical protein